MQQKQFILLLLGLICLSVNLYAIPGKKLPRKYKKIQQYLDKATKNKLAGIKDKLKDPKQSQTLNKKEVKNNLSDLGIELIKLEKNSDDSNDSRQLIGDLTKQIEELRKSVEEIKKSLKSNSNLFLI